MLCSSGNVYIFCFVFLFSVCGHVDLIDLLQSEGAEVSCPDIHHAYPLHYAAQMCGATGEGADPKSGLKMLSKLLMYDAEVDCKDQDNRTPLLWAASSGIFIRLDTLLINIISQ